jgi:hypothetical protein
MNKPQLPHGGLEYSLELIDPRGRVICRERALNLVPIEGLNHMLNVALKGVTPITTWYIGLFEGNATPTPTITAATLPGLLTECTTYTPGTRVEFVDGNVANGNTDNAASLAEFTSTADKQIYGAFLSGASTKGATSSVILSAVRFPSPKPFSTGSILRVLASPSIAST